MAATHKTDNANLAGKLELRRQMIRVAFGDQPIRVFDACQGEGVIWRELKKELPVSQYWGVDLKPKAGRLRINSAVLLRTGIDSDVFDVDTYGWPHEHLNAILCGMRERCVVFLTIGRKGEVFTIPNSVLSYTLGKKWPICLGLHGKLFDICCSFLLTLPAKYDIIVVQAKAAQAVNARYMGLWLERKGQDHGKGNDHRMDGPHV